MRLIFIHIYAILFVENIINPLENWDLSLAFSKMQE